MCDDWKCKSARLIDNWTAGALAKNGLSWSLQECVMTSSESLPLKAVPIACKDSNMTRFKGHAGRGCLVQSCRAQFAADRAGSHHAEMMAMLVSTCKIDGVCTEPLLPASAV